MPVSDGAALGTRSSCRVAILDGSSMSFERLRDYARQASAPVLLVGASSAVEVRLQRQVQSPVESLPDPFYLEEAINKLRLLLGSPKDHGDSRLTRRQREVLGLVADGLSTDQIAAASNISPGTVKSHLQAIFARLGATNRSEAIAIAKDRGVL
jgi:DNA-binding NarL/FixJ family response regulator